MSCQIIGTFSGLPDRLSRRPDLVRRAARAQVVLLLEAGSEAVRLRLAAGALECLPADGPMDGWDIALRATPGAWADHWKAVPAPDAFDIFGMARRGRMRIEGNFLSLMQHLQVVKDILALPRSDR